MSEQHRQTRLWTPRHGGDRDGFDDGGPATRPLDRRAMFKGVAAGLLGGIGAAGAVIPAAAAFDEGWRFCQKCRCLHSIADGERGSCVVGRRHSVEGSAAYYLAFGPGLEGPLSEGGWRYCRKCHVLHYTRLSRGDCPDGGRHALPAGPLEIVVSVNFTPEPGLQGGWRHCTKCRSLHWVGDGTRGPCPAGNRHNNGPFGFDYQVLYHV